MNAAFHHWQWRLALLLYRLAGPLLLVLSLLPWLKKTAARGGWNTPLGERFGRYRDDAEWEPCAAIHLHAVSVGETMIAIKLLQAWSRSAEQRVVLAVSTATAWQLASQANLTNVRLVYAPVDFWPFVRAYLRRFQPAKIILVEAEAWPEFMQQAQLRQIPVSMVNARLSARSERRFRKVASIVRPLFAGLQKIGVQENSDAARFVALGAVADAIIVTGSVKFDPGNADVPSPRDDFAKLLDQLRHGRPVVLAASTHDGEETYIGEAVRRAGAFYVCVPRHAERRDEVRRSLTAANWKVVQRSKNEHERVAGDCYLVDTTGELRDWTALADIVVIGKSFLAEGGQNPCEAVMAGKCVITGPHMENFQPLTDDIHRAGGMRRVEDQEQLASTIAELLSNPALRTQVSQKALDVLKQHQGATIRTVESLLDAATCGCNSKKNKVNYEKH